MVTMLITLTITKLTAMLMMDATKPIEHLGLAKGIKIAADKLPEPIERYAMTIMLAANKATMLMLATNRAMMLMLAPNKAMMLLLETKKATTL